MGKKSRISQYREAKGYSQSEIAKHLSVTQQSISSWEIGRTFPKPYQMKKMADFLDVEIDELFYDVFNETKEKQEMSKKHTVKTVKD